MSLNVTLPQLLGSSSSCKDCMVSVLALEFPLTVKEIFEKVKIMANFKK